MKAATGEVVTGEELGGLMDNTLKVDEEYNLSRSYHALLCQWNYRPFCRRRGGEFRHNQVGEKS